MQYTKFLSACVLQYEAPPYIEATSSTAGTATLTMMASDGQPPPPLANQPLEYREIKAYSISIPTSSSSSPKRFALEAAVMKAVGDNGLDKAVNPTGPISLTKDFLSVPAQVLLNTEGQCL